MSETRENIKICKHGWSEGPGYRNKCLDCENEKKYVRVSRFTPLEEMLNEAWDDPKKREHLRKAVFECIEQLERDLAILNGAWEDATKSWQDEVASRQARLDAVENINNRFTFHGLQDRGIPDDVVFVRFDDVLEALEQK